METALPPEDEQRAHEALGLGHMYPPYDFAWLRDGKPIPHAGDAQYTLAPVDAGHSKYTVTSKPQTRLARSGRLRVVLSVSRTRSTAAHRGHPPGPRLPHVAQTALLRTRPFWFLERTRAHVGSRFTINAVAHPPLVFIADPVEAGEVFSAPVDVLAPGEGGRAITPIVGPESFMLADGELHRRGRSRLAGLFTAQATADHVAMVRELADREVHGWSLEAPVALHDRLRALTLRIVLTALFGSSLDAEPELLPRLLSMLSISEGTMLTLAATRRVPSLRGRWRRFLAERDDVDRILQRMIQTRRAEGAGGDDALGILSTGRDDAGDPLTPRYIRDSLMSLILAGHETTSAELAWAFQLVAHDARVQHELCTEARGDAGTTYLTAVVREVLRHRPVFLFAIPRAVKQPIEIGDWTHTPPAHLLVCLYLIHHDPQLFADPDRFLPERFLQNPPGVGWLSWGGGRKLCLGHRLATLELETILATALRTLEVRPVHDRLESPRWRSVIVAPGDSCRVTLHRRKAPSTPTRTALSR